MSRLQVSSISILLLACTLLVGQEEVRLQSGPKAGEPIPGSFECLHINGPARAVLIKPREGEPGYYVAQPRCLVCKFALNPTVLIIATEPGEGLKSVLSDATDVHMQSPLGAALKSLWLPGGAGAQLIDKKFEKKETVFNAFLAELDQACVDHDERSFSVGVIYISADARDSTRPRLDLTALMKKAADKDEISKIVDGDEELAKRLKELKDDPDRKQAKRLRELAESAELERRINELRLAAAPIDEARRRILLFDRLSARAEKLKHGKVIIATCPPVDEVEEKVDEERKKGLKDFNINSKAEYTILFYERMKVIDNWSFAPDAFSEKDAAAIMKKVKDFLPLRKKIAEGK